LAPAPSNPAEQELERRISDLLHEAAAADDEERHEEALEILSRLFILDEEHEGARVLEETIREKLGVDSDTSDDRISEGVRLLEQGEPEQARALFQEVLEAVPGHREAQHHLEQADAMIAMTAEKEQEQAEEPPEADAPEEGLPLGEFSGESTRDAVEDHGAIDVDAGTEEEASLPVGEIPETRDLPTALIEEEVEEPGLAPHAPEEEPAAAVKSGRKGLNVKLVAVAAVVLLAAAGAYVYFGTDLLGGAGSGAADGAQDGGSGEGGLAEALGEAGGRSTDELLAEADRITGKQITVEAVKDDTEKLREALERAQTAMDSGNYGQAVIAYNDVISLDPTNPAANAGLSEAGRLYRVRRAQYEELDRAKQSFLSGDYTSALRVLYRMPADLEPAAVERYKANAWYNLGLVELKAGNTGKAMEHMNDVLQIVPEDQKAMDARGLAERFHGAVKDLSYYAEAERLTFRTLED
jgi:tetratricopeptide (TPR) repeat protein